MEIIDVIILGLIQGLTEFIPVSSSGHLVIGQYFLDGSSDHLFLEWINIGTLLALLVFFRQRIITIIKGALLRKKYRLARNIVLTSVPAGLVGYLGADYISTAAFFGSVITVLISLIVVGLVMIIIDYLPQASTVQDGEQLTVKRALVIGVLQVFALIPGVSRSGSTIIAGRLMGLPSAGAAEYSFLASIPIMCGVILKLLIGSDDRQYFLDHLEPLLIGNFVAFVSGLLAVGFLMRYLSNHSLAVFGWYRVGLSAIVVIILLVQ